MGRCDLYAAGAERRIHIGVRDDGNALTHQGQGDELTNEGVEARVVRMNSDRSIAQHGFRSRGGDHDVVRTICRARAICQRVADVPERTLFFL